MKNSPAWNFLNSLLIYMMLIDQYLLRRSEELLKQFALWDWADEIIEAYSHGMKQRLIIAAALLHDPKVMVIDEPMVGLDPEAVRMVKDILKGSGRTKCNHFCFHSHVEPRRGSVRQNRRHP